MQLLKVKTVYVASSDLCNICSVVFSPRGGTGGGIEMGRMVFCVERRGGTGGGVKGGTVDEADILKPNVY